MWLCTMNKGWQCANYVDLEAQWLISGNSVHCLLSRFALLTSLGPTLSMWSSIELWAQWVPTCSPSYLKKFRYWVRHIGPDWQEVRTRVLLNGPSGGESDTVRFIPSSKNTQMGYKSCLWNWTCTQPFLDPDRSDIKTVMGLVYLTPKAQYKNWVRALTLGLSDNWGWA